MILAQATATFKLTGYWGPLARATWVTIQYTLISFCLAVVLGLLLALMRESKSKVPRSIARTYTEILKNMPLLTSLFIIYYGLASVGLVFSAFLSGVIALSTFYGAYLSEIFRAGLSGVGRDQREAAQATGLGPITTMTAVVLPQAFRLALPGTGTMLVDLLKGTSLLVTISGAELMTEGQIITSETFKALQVYVLVGAIYFALCFPLSRLVAALERRTNRGAAFSLRRRALLRAVSAVG